MTGIDRPSKTRTTIRRWICTSRMCGQAFSCTDSSRKWVIRANKELSVQKTLTWNAYPCTDCLKVTEHPSLRLRSGAKIPHLSQNNLSSIHSGAKTPHLSQNSLSKTRSGAKTTHLSQKSLSSIRSGAKTTHLSQKSLSSIRSGAKTPHLSPLSGKKWHLRHNRPYRYSRYLSIFSLVAPLDGRKQSVFVLF